MSGGEIVLILIIYLLLFGAKGIPTLAQTLGKALYQFRNAARDVQHEIMQSADEVRKEAASVRLDQADVDSPTIRNESKSHFPPPPPPPPSPEIPAEEKTGADKSPDGAPV